MAPTTVEEIESTSPIPHPLPLPLVPQADLSPFPTPEQLLLSIQTLYELSVSTYTPPPPSAQSTHPSIQTLATLINRLTTELRALASLTAATPPIPIPPETIAYVDAGRNPDIYTREFVEAVGETAEYLKGRSEAMRGFRDVLAEEIGRGRPELKEAAERVVANTGG